MLSLLCELQLMKNDKKISYLENTLYSKWVFRDAVQAVMKQHGVTEEQALSTLRNALEKYECSVAQYWLTNWRVSYFLHTFSIC